jgi:stress response protein YsnF
VRVGKQASQREQTVQDKVRQTEVKVEKTGTPGSSYGGPERRKRKTAYSGAERRMALR